MADLPDYRFTVSGMTWDAACRVSENPEAFSLEVRQRALQIREHSHAADYAACMARGLLAPNNPHLAPWVPEGIARLRTALAE